MSKNGLIRKVRLTFFLKNRIQNAVNILFPDSFLKKQDWAYLWINSLTFYTVCFYCMPSWGLWKHTETKLQTTYFYLNKAFWKNKKRSGTSSLSHFQHDFWRKIFLLLYSITRPNFIFWLPLLREIQCNMCIAFVC